MYSRREFLTYAWGAALALLAAEGAAITFFFMLPRFRAGEFGGIFHLGPVNSLPLAGTSQPASYPAGKF